MRTSTPRIAIVGMACRYPDADRPRDLWENVLARRRAFRRLPRERLSPDYQSSDGNAPDLTYATHAAVLEGYEFDRLKYCVGAATARSADLAHWLALDVANAALADAGFAGGELLPRERTAVIIGNTLTGEFSRAATLRLRWPYVRRVVDAGLETAIPSAGERAALLHEIERAFKAPFAPVDGETLAGGLSNTIAGRIANYFDLKGGGYTVDGACSSSLLAVAHACQGLLLGDFDAALAGGVDLSLDPFELVGFAKAGALAVDDMRVYDARPTGFWPGEGCGVVVLMRLDDARSRGRRIYGIVRGWGMSTDGSGGITRPAKEGQLLALRRAYARAGFGAHTVGFFEGHGTGTAIGDATELAALCAARRESGQAPAAALGSVKANIGHTKAAAGIAGLIKAALAVDHAQLPPTSGCQDPHRLLGGDAPLRILEHAEAWPQDVPLRAGVSSMGFGGINVHLVLEGTAADGRRERGAPDLQYARARQDTELFTFAADTRRELRASVDRLLARAQGLSFAELTDAAVHSQRSLARGDFRIGLLASTPAQLETALRGGLAALERNEDVLDVAGGVFVGGPRRRGRVGLLFTGQGAPIRLTPGLWGIRFEEVAELYARASLPLDARDGDTAVAQPAVVAASLAGLRVLERLGVEADVAIGHSLGELTALCWAGTLPEQIALALATTRGDLMSRLASGPGAMAAIACPAALVEPLIDGTPVVVAGINADDQTVVSGPRHAVAAFVSQASARGHRAAMLKVSHAFHSPLMAPVSAALDRVLSETPFLPLRRPVVSTTTGGLLQPDEDLRSLFGRQLVAPVRFRDALRASGDVDLFLEVGPGATLASLASATVAVPTISVDVGGPSLRGLLAAAGAAFALGAAAEVSALAEGRFARPFNPEHLPSFLTNPCETTASPRTPAPATVQSPIEGLDLAPESPPDAPGAGARAVLCELVARKTELPIESVRPDSRFLSDLHLNSLTVSELLGQAARQLRIAPLTSPLDFADAPIEVAAAALERMRTDPEDAAPAVPAGIETWVRAFVVREREYPLRDTRSDRQGPWRIAGTPGHPLTTQLAARLASGTGGPGTIVCLDAERDTTAGVLLEAAQAALRAPAGRFLVVQPAPVASAFARTLHAEAPHLDVGVVTLDPTDPQAAERVAAEAAALEGFSDARWDGERRLTAVAELLPVPAGPASVPLTPTDVLLITGGGKGIGAECGLALARKTGVRLALVGRSAPADDAALAANLDRMTSRGVHLMYVQADVSRAAEIRGAIEEVERVLGPVTAVLHAAGVNEPALIGALNPDALRATAAPKVDGARHLAACLPPGRLRFFVSFGSIIARTGLPGEAHYAMANEELRAVTDDLARSGFPAFTVEWSVWAAAGMGERLGRVDELSRRGVTPIDITRGADMLERLLANPPAATSVIVAGRFGESVTLPRARTPLPVARFLEHPRVDYAGIELVADADIAMATDPYLADHRLDGQVLFPGVMGLEAMAQAATALACRDEPPTFDHVEFLQPIAVPDDGRITLRVAALLTEAGTVSVSLRTSETSFQADHFRATCRFAPEGAPPALEWTGAASAGPLPVDPQRDLYGSLLFHSGRFARIQSYRHLFATECVAEIGAGQSPWFGPFLSQTLWLGDPGARDAALHATQACIPQRRLVPVGVDAIYAAPCLAGPCQVRARQREERGPDYVWDLELFDREGRRVEAWRGLRLRAVGSLRVASSNVPLLGPYVERSLSALGHRTPARVLVVGQNGNLGSTDFFQFLSGVTSIHRRPDGRPELADGHGLSFAHAGALAMAIVADGAVGCDVEPVTARSWPVWQDLLGLDRSALAALIARERQEDPGAGATRVWTAVESLKKAGAPPNVALLLERLQPDGWVTLRAGTFDVSTWIGEVAGHESMAIAVATGEPDASL